MQLLDKLINEAETQKNRVSYWVAENFRSTSKDRCIRYRIKKIYEH